LTVVKSVCVDYEQKVVREYSKRMLRPDGEKKIEFDFHSSF
jgi:hypothetical protein